MGWAPTTFWEATPVEFCAAVDARINAWEEEDSSREFDQFRAELQRAGIG